MGAGILIEAPAFPGWEDLGAMAAHFRFVRDHHKLIKKVGLVTDSALGKVAEGTGHLKPLVETGLRRQPRLPGVFMGQ